MPRSTATRKTPPRPARSRASAQAKAATPANPASARDPTPDSTRSYEAALGEFEYALWHLGSAFARWRRECQDTVPGPALNGNESAILHMIHLNDSPKGLMDLSRLLHRDDLPNIQYGLKKLASLGLIEKNGRSRKNMTYAVSDKGRAVVDAYLDTRRRVLVRMFMRVARTPDELTDLVMLMHLMIGIYGQAGDLAVNRHP